jgi:hypothetical protein
MSKKFTLMTTLALSVTAFAPSAFAEDVEKTAMMDAPVMEMNNGATEAAVIAVRADMPEEVMETVETSNFIAVEGPDGQIYYNHIVEVSELPDPELNLRVIETFEVAHDGAVYTNKLVEEVE